MLRFKQFIREDGVAVNCAGAGNIAGIGVGPDGEPGVSPKKHRKHKKSALMAASPLKRNGGDNER